MNYDIVEVVIDKLVRTFKLREWQYDVEEIVEDVVTALRFIGAAKVYAEKISTVTVNGGIAKIPRDCNHIKHVNNKSQYYRESGNFIEIDLEDGAEVNIYYQAIPVDTRGYPLIVDAVEVQEAIMWYLVKILALQREIVTVNWREAESEWQWRCGSARAALNSLNLQQVNKMYQDFVQLNPAKDVHVNEYETVRGNTLDRSRHTRNI